MTNLNEDNNENNGVYVLSPSGVLYKALLMCPKNIEELDQIAEYLFSYVENYSRRYYGEGENISSIVFDVAGGRFKSIKNIKESTDDLDEISGTGI